MSDKSKVIVIFMICFHCSIILYFSSYGQIAISKESEEKLSAKIRDTICLNGLWDFLPDKHDLTSSEKENWGSIRVPGSWHNKAWWTKIPGIEKKGKNWNLDFSKVNQAIYRKNICIPINWSGKSIFLDLERVSTDAIVKVDDAVADTIRWPGGIADLSKFVLPGKKHVLELMVYAIPSSEMAMELMGTATTQARLKKQSLSSRGIIGNVFLRSLPNNTRVAGVFVNTSVRKKQISFDIELENVNISNQLDCKIKIADQKGNVVKTFFDEVKVLKGEHSKFNLKEQWQNPLLWDLDQPNLYKAHIILKHKNKDILDDYAVEFGFREFWIDGKDFYLNNKKINLRPTNNAVGYGMNELIDAGIKGLRKAGFNFVEIWPSDITNRGHLHFNSHYANRASKKGMLISAPLPPSSSYIMDNKWQYSWDKPGMKSEWEVKMKREIKKLWNEPSIIMWVCNPNFFGHANDQNPYVIGQKGWNKSDQTWQIIANAGNESIGIIKKHDPTRPVFFHHGAYVGDIHTMNNYLNLHPLQEREEWLNHYAIHGDIPYMAIEFGTPHECTMLRGRIHFAANQVTEPLFTEFSAIYFGKEAYRTETNAYRNEMKENFLGGQKYKFWQHNRITGSLPAFQKLEELFIKNTWRSWRTYGISGGMNPWSNAHGFVKPLEGDSIKMPEFKPGRTGTYFSKVSSADLKYWDEKYWEIRKSGKALISNNQSTLGYIGGRQGEFTEKKHSFFEKDKLLKQIILINDSRKNLDYKWTCTFQIEGDEIAKRKGKGVIRLATVEKIPVQIELPYLKESGKKDGKIILEAVIGEKTHLDTFSYRVFTKPIDLIGQVNCFDPQGLSKSMFEDLGLEVLKWNGELQIPLLIIGREALSSGNQLPGNIQKYVENGGSVLIMGQKRKWIEETAGFRTARHQTRYVYPINEEHPVVSGIDHLDLRNWGGHSTLEEAYPDYLNGRYKKGEYGLPYYGWHWGNRGTVSSVPIEKPHFGGWRPILECEFDMAYTPLIEFDYGKGKIVICTLDLEDYYKTEPAASLLAKNLFQYIKEDIRIPKSENVYYSGDEGNKNILDQLGLIYEEREEIPSETDLMILGNKNGIDQNKVLSFIEKGGTVIRLNQKSSKGIFQTELEFTENFYGSINIAGWPVLEGLSASDLRWRNSGSNWLLSAGCKITGDGLIGEKHIGKGKLVLIQLDPEGLDADSITFFRYTRWRQYRALSQILSNLGCSFQNDKLIFQVSSSSESINLEGRWFAKLIHKSPVTLSVVTDTKDKGISTEAVNLINPDADISEMHEKLVPMRMEDYGGIWSNANGEAIFRKNIEIKADMFNKDLELTLGVVDDFDQTYFNGHLVGKIDDTFPEFWGYERKYIVPASIVKEGNNVLVVRVFDRFGEGGMLGSEKPMQLKILDDEKRFSFYHPDYRTDFTLGDDPYRYFRW